MQIKLPPPPLSLPCNGVNLRLRCNYVNMFYKECPLIASPYQDRADPADLQSLWLLASKLIMAIDAHLTHTSQPQEEKKEKRNQFGNIVDLD